MSRTRTTLLAHCLPGLALAAGATALAATILLTLFAEASAP
ncbi:hypothetical protein [Falsiroseomonas sp.]|nr:hypothetical protein [Falsiroseomonas sp.]MDP3417892.1 hypothetical protein [Falsiroseomonas sp.]